MQQNCKQNIHANFLHTNQNKGFSVKAIQIATKCRVSVVIPQFQETTRRISKHYK